MGEFQGKVAIVTGGSRGIGRAIVLMLAREGCHVVFNYAHSKDAADALVKEVKALGVKCQAAQVDICDFDAVKQWVDDVKEAFGQLDFLVNNAGVKVDKSLMMMLQEDWGRVIDTNLNGMFNATRSCIVTFLKQKSGAIVNISSVSGLIGLMGQTNYAASKGAMNAFTKALAKEGAPRGVRVNAVAPGFVETDMLADFSDEQRKKVLNDVPLGRVGSVYEVAQCVRFLLSAESRYMTGQILAVDGGLTI